jgi:hypothetical protein
MSVAYGRNCLNANAHPAWAIRANILCCGGPLHVRQEYLETIVYSEDGEYITIEDELKRRPYTDKEIANEYGSDRVYDENCT